MKIVDHGVRYELKVPNPESEFVGPRYRVYNFWKNILVKKLSDYPNDDIIRQQKKYFVKVRAYKTVGKSKVYGAYSAVRSCKVK